MISKNNVNIHVISEWQRQFIDNQLFQKILFYLLIAI